MGFFAGKLLVQINKNRLGFQILVVRFAALVLASKAGQLVASERGGVIALAVGVHRNGARPQSFCILMPSGKLVGKKRGLKVSLAIRMASSLLRAVKIAVTGPKISSRAIVWPGCTLSNTVGAINNPLPISSAVPPVTATEPSAL